MSVQAEPRYMTNQQENEPEKSYLLFTSYNLLALKATETR